MADLPAYASNPISEFLQLRLVLDSKTLVEGQPIRADGSPDGAIRQPME